MPRLEHGYLEFGEFLPKYQDQGVEDIDLDIFFLPGIQDDHDLEMNATPDGPASPSSRRFSRLGKRGVCSCPPYGLKYVLIRLITEAEKRNLYPSWYG